MRLLIPILLPFPIQTHRTTMRPLMHGDGMDLNQAILETWNDLSLWMDWAKGKKPLVQETEQMVREFYEKSIERRSIHLGIFHNNKIIGVCGFIPKQVEELVLGLSKSLREICSYLFNCACSRESSGFEKYAQEYVMVLSR